MKKMINISIRETIIFLLISVAYGMFAFFSLKVVFEYKQELTGINQGLEHVEEMSLPTITVCSQDIFKNITKETTTEMVLQNLNEYVFSWEDLFDESFASGFSKPSWDPHREIFSNYLGLCYSLRAKKTMTPKNFYLFYIYLPLGQKYQVINQDCNWYRRNCYLNL